jgi:hypothetical protein
MKAQKYGQLRPKLKGYLLIAGMLLLLWLGFVWLVQIKAQELNMELRDMNPVLRWGIAAILSPMLLIFSVHWWGKAVASEKAGLAAYKANVMAQIAEQQATQERTYALEIRGVGLTVDDWHQSSIWRETKKTNNNFTSIYSRDPKDYDSSLSSRKITRDINIRVAFKHSANGSVAYWPIPVFSIAPPKQPSDTGAASNILNGRNAATLGVTLFLWQDAENTTHAQGMIERLFQFFDDNPEVPQALIVSEDGDVTRDGLRVAGTPGLQNSQVVPTIYESMTGLLVTRSDRVDRYIRRYATHEREDNQNKSTDLGKLWAFYWEHSPKFRKVYEEGKRAEGIKHPYGPGTMSTAYWQSQLPALWKTISNRGPGEFQPSPWLPIRWAQHQVKEFDAAPVLGYLHRPIKVSMQDENGKRLKPALQARALLAGSGYPARRAETGAGVLRHHRQPGSRIRPDQRLARPEYRWLWHRPRQCRRGLQHRTTPGQYRGQQRTGGNQPGHHRQLPRRWNQCGGLRRCRRQPDGTNDPPTGRGAQREKPREPWRRPVQVRLP